MHTGRSGTDRELRAMQLYGTVIDGGALECKQATRIAW